MNTCLIGSWLSGSGNRREGAVGKRMSSSEGDVIPSRKGRSGIPLAISPGSSHYYRGLGCDQER